MNLRLPALFLSLLILRSFSANAQWEDQDRLTPSFHKGRREAFRTLMPENSVAIFFANPTRTRSNDVDYQYSQDPNFYYLSGYLEPNSILLIFKNALNLDGNLVNEVIFVQQRNKDRELWTGKRLGIDGVKRNLGFEAVYNGSDFKEFGIDFSKFDHILVKYPDAPSYNKSDSADIADLSDQVKEKVSAFADKVDKGVAARTLAQLREIKSASELVLMQKAIDISILGFTEMMKALNTSMTEYQAQAIVEYHMKKNGSEYPGYVSIAGSGGNGCVLHYTFNRKQLADGELLLADMGAEYHNYTADITRTVPVNGKFSEEQKIIYQIVLDAQNAGIEACIAGNGFRASHKAATEVVAKGLMKLGIIKMESDYIKFFMHGTSHYLGLDVHDAGTFGPLKSGTVMTVEPGIYIPKGSDCDPKWWNIGIRIEDDILVTDSKPRILTGALPREIEDIERLMSK